MDSSTASTTTFRPTYPTPPSDTIKWNDKVTAPIIIPIIAIVVIITFFICVLVKCLKVTWDKKRRSDMYEITDLLPEKSKVLPDSVAIDEGDLELPNENEKLHHRHVFMSSTSNNSTISADNGDDLENGLDSDHRHVSSGGKRPTGIAALKLLKFSNLRSVITKKKMVSTTMACGHEETVEGERMVTLDIESGLESGTETMATTSIKQVNGSKSNGVIVSTLQSSPNHRISPLGHGLHDSSNDTNDSNFGDELEDDVEVPGYMNSNLDEVDTPGQPSVSPAVSSNPLRKAPIALTESEV